MIKEHSDSVIRLQRGRFFQRTMLLDRYRIRVEFTIDSFKVWRDNRSEDLVRNSIPDELSKSDGVLSVGEHFGGKDKYLWVSAEITLPPEKDGCEVYGRFDFGKTHTGYTHGFEGLLYVNGKPYQGVDGNHRDVNFNSFAGQTVKLDFMFWTGFGGKSTCEHCFSEASIGYLDKTADELYYLFRCGKEALEEISEDDPVLYRLTDVLEKTLKLINFDEEQFDITAPSALEYIKSAYKKLKIASCSVSCVGHTHIDVAWLWRLKHTREKAMRSFTTVDRLMEEFDDYRFLQTQPQLYSYVKNDMPELYEKIVKRSKEGKWETEGGMWLEADCNLTSLESLIRQLFYGMRFFEKEFGCRSEYLWLPDVFGYSWALPQILKKVGIKSFVTTKISWNDYNTMPNDLFFWRGIDGTEILTYFITTPEEEKNLDYRLNTYNGTVSPYTVNGNRKKFHNKDITDETLMCFGWGDGGGGVTRDMLKMCHAIKETPGLPDIKLEKAGDFLNRLHSRVENENIQLPVWDGELYLENHRGTYTTEAKNKKMNRLGEHTLRRAEWISAAAALCGEAYPTDKIAKAWEILLRNQFHDIIPGSSVREVYIDSHKEYSEMFGILNGVCDKALGELVAPNCEYVTVISNSDSRVVQTVILDEPDVTLSDSEGNSFPSQSVGNTSAVALELPEYSLTSYRKTSAASTEAKFAIDIVGRCVDTPFYKIRWDDKGRISSVIDLENENREVLSGDGNKLLICEDIPNWGEAWNIETSVRLKKRELMLRSVTSGDNGPLFADIVFEYFYNKSEIRQRMRMYSYSRRIDFITEVDWNESGVQLNTSFEVDIRSTKASYEIQGGYVERPTHENTTWDIAKFEVVGHTFADLSDATYGVALLNDSKYGYHTLGNSIGLTLLRSSKSPDTQADMCVHNFTYSLLPHRGSLVGSNVFDEAKALNYTAEVLLGLSDISGSVVKCRGNVTLEAFKAAEDSDGYILRVREELGGQTSAEISFFKAISAYAECNLLEEKSGEIKYASTICDRFAPFEIKTYRVYF